MLEMGSNSQSKRSKACIEDRISELPDVLLCVILSFLTTAEAVKTSVLSRRWMNVWTAVPKLELIALTPSRDSGLSAGFVDRALLFRGQENIHKFHLRCCGITGLVSRIDAWICAAVRCNVVEVSLEFDEDQEDPYEFLVLPRSLFLCNTLESLKLTLGSPDVAAIAPTSSSCFPRLKRLHVKFNRPKYIEQIQKLFSRCPALEKLEIEGHLGRVKQDAVLNIIISAPKLKELLILLDAEIMKDEYQYKIFINANVPNLKRFSVTENFLASYSLNAKSLTEADIDFGYWNEEGIPAMDVLPYADADRTHRLFAQINNVEYLRIRAPILTEPHIEYQRALPTFNHLKRLDITMPDCCTWNIVTNMLKISPNLEHLVVDNNVPYWDDDDDDEEFEDEWCPPERVPVCLSSCLKFICLWGFRKWPDEMKLAEYLLKHGEVLNKLQFYFCEIDEESVTELSQKISLIPKGSKTCQIELFHSRN